MSRGVMLILSLLLAVLSFSQPCGAQPAQPGSAPPASRPATLPTAVAATQPATLPAIPPVPIGPPAALLLTIPAGATATVDDKDIADRRTITFNAIPVGQMQRAKVAVKFADGTEEQRLVDLAPGRRIPLVVNPAPIDKPVAVALHGLPPITSVAISPDGHLVAAATEDKVVLLWDLIAGKPVRSFTGHTAGVTSVSFTADGKELLTGSTDATAMLWDVETGAVRQTYKGHKGPVNSAAISPDQKWVVTGSQDNTAIVWEASTGRKVREIIEHKGEVSSVMFSPDGSKIATGSFDGTLGVWDTLSGEKFFLIVAHPDYVSGVAFTADGAKVITCSYDNSAHIYDVATSKRLSATGKQPLDVLAIVATPDNTGVFTTCRDATVVLWSIATGQKLRMFSGHTNEVNTVTVTRDGRYMVSAGNDGTVRLWEIATGVELACFAADSTGKNWAALAPDGLFDASNDGRGFMGFIFARELPAASADQLFKDFFQPGLLSQVYRGDRPFARAQLGRSLPPTVKITSPKAKALDEAAVTVTVEATDVGGGVSDIFLYDNGARIAPHAEPVREGKTLQQTFRLSLIQGVNRIRAGASNGDGSWDSAAAEIELTCNRAPDRKARMYVVAIGVSDSDRGASYSAARDATALAEAIRHHAGKLYDRVDVIPLLDGEATRAMVEDTLADVAALAKPHDALVLLLHGQGAQIDQQFYFATGDFPAGQRKSEKSLRSDGVSVSRLAEILGSTPALQRAMVMDLACPDMPLPSREFGLRGAMERLARAQGIHAIASIAPPPASGKSPQSSDIKHSLLTYSLLAALDGDIPGPLNGKPIEPAEIGGTIDVMEWFNHAAAQCPPAAAELKIAPSEVQTTTQAKAFPVVQLVK